MPDHGLVAIIRVALWGGKVSLVPAPRHVPKIIPRVPARAE